MVLYKGSNILNIENKILQGLKVKNFNREKKRGNPWDCSTSCLVKVHIYIQNNLPFSDVTVKLPPDLKSSKDVKVTINPGDLRVICHNGDILIEDTLLSKIKTLESFWSISGGKLLIHLGICLCSTSLILLLHRRLYSR